MASDAVRIRPETHAKLKALSDRSGDPMPVVLEKAVEAYRRQKFLEASNLAFERLRSDKKAWTEEEAERAVWDRTVGDDLEGDR